MTRDGRNARIVRFDYRGYAPLLVTVENKSEEPLSDRLKQYVQAKPSESVYEYYENGKVCAPHLNANIASDLDLVMASEKKVYYSNVYRFAGATFLYNNLFETYEEAHSYAIAHLEHSDYPELKSVVTVKVEWEE